MGQKQPQDDGSGLVARRWVRTSRRGDVLTEQTLEGRPVEATWQDRHGHVQRLLREQARTAGDGGGDIAAMAFAAAIRNHKRGRSMTGMSDEQSEQAGFAIDTSLRREGFKEADTAAALESLNRDRPPLGVAGG
jgi:hypothetical protein